MPIWLRRFTFNSIDEFYKKEREEYDKASGKGELLTENTKTFKPAIPEAFDMKPTYSSKVSRPAIPNPAVANPIYSTKGNKK